jgi:hypothetical protein
LPSPVPLPVPPDKRDEKLPAFDLPPNKPDGFDPYKARSSAARDAARDLNNQRSRVPSSVAPSITDDEKLRRNVGDSFLPPCPLPIDKVLAVPKAPNAPPAVIVNQPMEARKKDDCRGEPR